jgi:hypothetical protein
MRSVVLLFTTETICSKSVVGYTHTSAVHAVLSGTQLIGAFVMGSS